MSGRAHFMPEGNYQDWSEVCDEVLNGHFSHEGFTMFKWRGSERAIPSLRGFSLDFRLREPLNMGKVMPLPLLRKSCMRF